MRLPLGLVEERASAVGNAAGFNSWDSGEREKVILNSLQVTRSLVPLVPLVVLWAEQLNRNTLSTLWLLQPTLPPPTSQGCLESDYTSFNWFLSNWQTHITLWTRWVGTLFELYTHWLCLHLMFADWLQEKSSWRKQSLRRVP